MLVLSAGLEKEHSYATTIREGYVQISSRGRFATAHEFGQHFRSSALTTMGNGRRCLLLEAEAEIPAVPHSTILSVTDWFTDGPLQSCDLVIAIVSAKGNHIPCRELAFALQLQAINCRTFTDFERAEAWLNHCSGVCCLDIA